MATMLDLPRELYLMVCSYLTPTELTRLAGASRDHYLAVQQPLYTDIKITEWRRLIKLVETMGKVPIVSSISAEQRRTWYKLSDAQLRERDIKRLDIVLDSRKDGERITGAILSNCVGALSRKCYGVRISLTLNRGWRDYEKQLEKFGLPGVRNLAMILPNQGGRSARNAPDTNIWELVLSGSTFTDLRSVYMTTRSSDLTDNTHQTLHQSVGEASPIYGSHPWKTKQFTDKDAHQAPFHALRGIEEIRLVHLSTLNVDTLQSLFGSDIIPQRLTQLEIVDCPGLHPVKHLGALSTLLQRALHLVQHLKLHLCKLPHFDDGDTFLDTQYTARIDEHPEEHPCSIIREIGQKVRHLDLALPFACSDLFQKPAKNAKVMHEALNYPDIQQEPYETLPDRLIAGGYKHRRVIAWHGVCCDAHRWNEMQEAAAHEHGNVSWEMLNARESHGSWAVSGCLPIAFDTRDVLMRPFRAVDDVG